jgi:hypothetical protein
MQTIEYLKIYNSNILVRSPHGDILLFFITYLTSTIQQQTLAFENVKTSSPQAPLLTSLEYSMIEPPKN